MCVLWFVGLFQCADFLCHDDIDHKDHDGISKNGKAGMTTVGGRHSVATTERAIEKRSGTCRKCGVQDEWYREMCRFCKYEWTQGLPAPRREDMTTHASSQGQFLGLASTKCEIQRAWQIMRRRWQTIVFLRYAFGSATT